MSAAHVSLIFADKEKDKEIERLRISVEEKNLIDILTLLFDHTKKNRGWGFKKENQRFAQTVCLNFVV